jgi:hypothetical protein
VFVLAVLTAGTLYFASGLFLYADDPNDGFEPLLLETEWRVLSAVLTITCLVGIFFVARRLRKHLGRSGP